MQPVSPEVWVDFERRLDEMGVAAPQRPDYRKWVRFYFDFCHKYGHAVGAAGSRGPFLAKLASKNQSVAQRSQASAAVGLRFQSALEAGAKPPSPAATPITSLPRPPDCQPAALSGDGITGLRQGTPNSPAARPIPRPVPQASAAPARRQESRQRVCAQQQNRLEAPLPDIGLPGTRPARPSVPGHGASWEQEYRDLEAAVLLRNYSPRTLEAYRFWIVRFQAFVRSRRRTDLGTQEVRGFLSDLAVREQGAASTQNQAFNARRFFYRHVLHREFGQLDGVDYD